MTKEDRKSTKKPKATKKQSTTKSAKKKQQQKKTWPRRPPPKKAKNQITNTLQKTVKNDKERPELTENQPKIQNQSKLAN